MTIAKHVRQSVIAWNEDARQRALSDADNTRLIDERRADRARDADRYQRNIDSLS